MPGINGDMEDLRRAVSRENSLSTLSRTSFDSESEEGRTLPMDVERRVGSMREALLAGSLVHLGLIEIGRYWGSRITAHTGFWYIPRPHEVAHGKPILGGSRNPSRGHMKTGCRWLL